MANLFDRYGIKEVADVTFYEIDTATGNPTKPVLYLDTLKVSTIEQTAENAEARGGKGNAALISWDFGKEITVNLEDALFSPKSLGLIYGDDGKVDELGDNDKIMKTLWSKTTEITIGHSNEKYTASYKSGKDTITLDNCTFYNAQGAVLVPQEKDGKWAVEGGYEYVTGEFPLHSGIKIDVTANGFPGTYYVTGDTFARNETSGKDEFFQFIIPKAKVLSESNTITLEAEGDPSVFSMSLKVLRPRDGVMMRLVQYNAEENA